MDHWILVAVVVLAGTVFVEASITIKSIKFEIFDKELVQENLKIVEEADGTITVDGTITTTKPVGDEYSVYEKSIVYFQKLTITNIAFSDTNSNS